MAGLQQESSDSFCVLIRQKEMDFSAMGRVQTFVLRRMLGEHLSTRDDLIMRVVSSLGA